MVDSVTIAIDQPQDLDVYPGTPSMPRDAIFSTTSTCVDIEFIVCPGSLGWEFLATDAG